MHHQLAQAHAPGMGHHGHAEAVGEQLHREHLVDAGQPAGIDLGVSDRVGLEQLLEHDPVLDVLSRGDPDRRHATRDRGVAQDVVGARGLLDPHRADLGERVHPLDGLRDAPHLVGIDHQVAVGADHLPRDACPSEVIREVTPDLELDMVEAVRDRLLAQPPDLLVVVAQPARRGGVRGVAVTLERLDACRASGCLLSEGRQRLRRCQGIGEIAEVDQVHQLLR